MKKFLFLLTFFLLVSCGFNDQNKAVVHVEVFVSTQSEAVNLKSIILGFDKRKGKMLQPGESSGSITLKSEQKSELWLSFKVNENDYDWSGFQFKPGNEYQAFIGIQAQKRITYHFKKKASEGFETINMGSGDFE